MLRVECNISIGNFVCSYEHRWCRIDFVSHTAEEDRHGLNNARALACEVVAIDCVSFLNENDIVQYLGFEVPGKIEGSSSHSATSESTSLLNRNNSNSNSNINSLYNELEEGEFEVTDAGAEIPAAYGGLNALEIAVVAEAKYFLSQKSIQRVVDGM